MARTSKRARRTSHLYLPGAFELFTPSKELVLKNIWIFAPLYAVTLVFYIHSWIWAPLPNHHIHLWQHAGGFSSAWPGNPLPAYVTFLGIGFSLLWLLVTLVIGTAAQIMSQDAQRLAAEESHFDYPILWRKLKRLWPRMLGLYIVLAVVVTIGLVLLIIPGLIFIRRYFFAPYVMLEKDTGIIESMQRSAALSQLNTSSVWGVIGVMFLIGLINIIPVIGGLVSFALGALYSVAPALRYTQLKKLV